MPLTCRLDSSSSVSLIHTRRSLGSQTSTTRTSHALRIFGFHHSLYPSRRRRKNTYTSTSISFDRVSLVLNGLHSRGNRTEIGFDLEQDAENGDEHYRLGVCIDHGCLTHLESFQSNRSMSPCHQPFVGVHICVDSKSQAATMIDTTLLDVFIISAHAKR